MILLQCCFRWPNIILHPGLIDSNHPWPACTCAIERSFKFSLAVVPNITNTSDWDPDHRVGLGLARKYSSPPSLGLSCGISTVFGNSLMDALYWHRNKTEVGKRERQESLKSWLAKPCCPDLASVDPCCFPQIEQEAVQIVIYGKNAYKPTKLVFMANEFTMCIWYCLLTILTLVLNHFYHLFLMSPHCELWCHKSGFV